MDASPLFQCFSEDGVLDECLLKSKLVEIKEKLENKQMSWDSFMVSLGELLTSTNSASRLKGVTILCKFINLQTSSSVTSEELKFLIEFLLARLKDHHSFIPVVVETLLFLLETFKIQDTQALAIFETLHKESFTQQLTANERFQAYSLIGLLFDNHKEAFRSINNDFLYGFIQIIEGERDPRCLMVSFKLFQKVVRFLQLGHLDEEVFDVISCYFPILYKPVRQSEITVTRDELHTELKKCFKSDKAFGPYAMNLFVEKLESDVESAKVDVYDFLKECADVYGLNCLEPFLSQLWTSIRVDLLQMNPGKLSEVAIQALTAVLRTIEVNKEVASNLIKDILKDLEVPLTHLELILTRPASSCLAAISTVSSFYFEITTDTIFPLILKHWIFDTKKDSREFIDEYTTFFERWHQERFDYSEKKFPCQESILMQLTSFLQSGDLCNRLSCLDCLSHLIQCSVSWTPIELQNLAKAIHHLIVEDDFDEKTSIKLNNVVKNFSHHHSEIANQQIIDFIIKKLPEPQSLSTDGSQKVVKYLFLLRDCIILDVHLSKLIEIMSDFHSFESSEGFFMNVYTHLVGLLTDAVTDVNQKIFDDSLLRPLLPNLLAKKLSLTTADKGMLSIFCKLMHFLPCNRKLELVEQITEHLSKTLLESNNSSLRLKDEQVLSHILCSMPIDFDYSWTRLQTALMTLLTLVGDQESCFILSMIEVLLNKTSEENSREFSQQLVNYHLSHPDQQIGVKLIISTNSALVIRGVSYSFDITRHLINILETNSTLETAKLVATFFVPFLKEYPHLSEENGGKISYSFAEKYFCDTNSILLDGYENSSGWRRELFALCLLNHLKNLPTNTVKDEITKFESIIILYLQSNEACDSLLTALECLSILIELKSPRLVNSLASVISKLIEFAQKNPRLKIRCKALNCLALLTQFIEDIQLMPHRHVILKDLTSVLDDRKRLVRSAAASALFQWMLLVQPV